MIKIKEYIFNKLAVALATACLLVCNTGEHLPNLFIINYLFIFKSLIQKVNKKNAERPLILELFLNYFFYIFMVCSII
jgi:hypothetical protein